MSWNLSAAIKHLVSSASGKSLHQCAKYVRQAIEAGGVSTVGRPVSACKYKTFLPTIGFNAIGQISGKINQDNWSRKNARPGDIAVMDHGEHGHICMWSGTQWISDFKQNHMWPYGGDGICYIFRYNGQIDGTLGSFIATMSTGLRYTVPLESQEDHKLMKNFGNIKYNLISSIIDTFGNFNIPLESEVQYENFISNDDSSISESIVESGMYWANFPGQGIDSDFTGAGGGKLPVPQGFYTDQVLYEFISHAEGNIGMRWVTEYRGNTVALRCGINGWDYAGGVHSPSIAKAIGVSPQEFGSWVTIDKRSGFSRRAIGGEISEGAAWGWATSPLTASNPYWQRLIPYYRDAMIWAWNQPIIQRVKDPGERLARMHSINWWGYHYLKGFNGGPGWKHRFEAARRACTGMRNYT